MRRLKIIFIIMLIVSQRLASWAFNGQALLRIVNQLTKAVPVQRSALVTVSSTFRRSSSSSTTAPPLHHRSSTLSSLHRHINMRIELLPALDDNYMYLLIDDKTNTCAVVDPVEPDTVLAAVSKHNVNLTTALTTHHHYDHAGGNEQLATLRPDLIFYGGDDRIKPDSLKKVTHGDHIQVGSLRIECLFTPCHTTGHICYYVKDEDGDPAVFTGDTLFSAACGKFFEGTKEQMYHALVEVLQKLPGNTRVYCGHEYTVSSLKYALHVEPHNKDIQEYFARAQELRKANQATIPSTIDFEMKINPFMRVKEKSVQEHVGLSDPVDVMGALRSEKDKWKPKM